MTPIISYISPTQVIAGAQGINLFIYGQNFDTNTVISFAGNELSTSFTSGNQLTTFVPSSLLVKGTLGSLAVMVNNLFGESNSAPFQIIPQNPTSLTDINNIVDGINLNNTSISQQTQSVYTKTINNVQNYTVTQDDTLQSIAMKVMGDASLWMDIVFINNLRYPYISDNLLDIAGSNTEIINLTRPAKIGDQIIYVNNLSQLLTIGAILYFNLSGVSFNSISEIHPVVEITTNSYNYEVEVSLDSPIQNNYVIGTAMNVLTTSNNTTSVVVRPGQTILIPSNIENNSIIKLNNNSSSDPNIFLGQDIFLDEDGNLTNDNNGDIGIVFGVDNLRQALSDRLSTELGELTYYPQYGNPLIDYIGSVDRESLAILSNKKISNTLLQDPRVSSITQINTSINGDVLGVSVDLEVSSMSSGATFNFIIK